MWAPCTPIHDGLSNIGCGNIVEIGNVSSGESPNSVVNSVSDFGSQSGHNIGFVDVTVTDVDLNDKNNHGSTELVITEDIACQKQNPYACGVLLVPFPSCGSYVLEYEKCYENLKSSLKELEAKAFDLTSAGRVEEA